MHIVSAVLDTSQLTQASAVKIKRYKSQTITARGGLLKWMIFCYLPLMKARLSSKAQTNWASRLESRSEGKEMLAGPLRLNVRKTVVSKWKRNFPALNSQITVHWYFSVAEQIFKKRKLREIGLDAHIEWNDSAKYRVVQCEIGGRARKGQMRLQRPTKQEFNARGSLSWTKFDTSLTKVTRTYETTEI